MSSEQTLAADRNIDCSSRWHWWYTPSWLGLDAPCVVSTWTWATSRTLGVEFPLRPVAAMFLVVWCIYLLDRCIDVASCKDWDQATGRLRFGRDYRFLFLTCLSFCFLGILGVLWFGLPRPVLERALLVGVGVGLHFLVFIKPILLGKKLPGKEFCVGIFFALGVFACLGVTARSLPLLASIAGLVAYNCLVIAARDTECDQANDPGGASHWWRTMNRDLLFLGFVSAMAAALCAVLLNEQTFYLSVATAFAAHLVLHLYANRLSGDAVRALADYGLLTPIPIMGGMACASI